jgi:hypothetical protein
MFVQMYSPQFLVCNLAQKSVVVGKWDVLNLIQSLKQIVCAFEIYSTYV